MKRGATISLSIAAVSLSLFFPQIAQARNMKDSTSSPSETTQSFAAQEARLMVPAEITLSDDLNTRKMQSGQQFQARLYETVHLKNGPELPHGTVLIGTVTIDPTPENGASKLALRFTQAKLKDGEVVPIKATLEEVLRPDHGFIATTYDYEPTIFNKQILQFEQLNALSGVDLHSQIANRNSGVFVATRKKDVNLHAGTVLELSIAAAQNSGLQNANGTSSLN